MSKKYRPSNGTEGVCFMEKHCFNCIHERFSHTQNHADKMCEIMSDTMIYNVDDPQYPEQWTYNEQGYPTCTAWVKWDWDNDGNPDDPDNPKCQPPDNPDQLCLPFELDAIQPEIEVKPQLQTA